MWCWRGRCWGGGLCLRAEPAGGGGVRRARAPGDRGGVPDFRSSAPPWRRSSIPGGSRPARRSWAQTILLDIIGAVVIGGTSLFGGKGKVVWTVFGVLFLVLIDTSLKMLGLSLFSVFAIKGAVILLAAVIDAVRTRFAARRLGLYREEARSMALLECENLRKSFFGVEVLHGVSFSLDRGRVLGLVGENGSGKSTTMNILGGVLPRDSGRIRLDGADYDPRGPRTRWPAASPSSIRN